VGGNKSRCAVGALRTDPTINPMVNDSYVEVVAGQAELLVGIVGLKWLRVDLLAVALVAGRAVGGVNLG
jgi:hypothetical protein